MWREIDELHTTLVPGFFAWAEDRSEMAMRRALADAHELLLVAEEPAGSVCGLAHLLLYDTPEGQGRRQVRRAHLDSVVVQAPFRRRGCGRALVAASQRWARDKGAALLLLTVWDGNVAAERFYASLGFQRVSQVLGSKL